nr:phospholipase A2 inhibitor and Ly6/PLAUR domain-containing protein-like [Chelonoidis abingdonii]
MVSFIFCLLPALLATTSAQAQTVTCQQCSSSADSCQPPSGTCTAETAKGGCITVAEENTLQGTKTTVLSRGCLNDFTGVIKGPVTVTLGNGKYVRINIAQCSTETCNSPALDVPTGSTIANGLQCPTCFSLNSDPCNSSVTPCTGDETYCIDFAGTIRRGKFCQLAAWRQRFWGQRRNQSCLRLITCWFSPSGTTVSALVGKGCATESTKDITAGTSLVSAVYTYNFTITTSKPAENTPTSGASPALGKFSFALYLPGLTGLLLVKLLS